MGKEKFEVFNTPSYAYLLFDTVDKLTLRKSGLVYNNEYLGSLNSNYNIYSPISGKIIGSKKVLINDKVSNALVVENDYKNKCFKMSLGKEKYDSYKRKDANSLFSLFNIDGKFNGKKYLMADLRISNTNLENKYFINEYNYEILETIDAIMEIFNISESYIAVNDGILAEALNEYIGIYPNIKLTSRISTGEEIINYSGYDIIKIYNALKFNRYYSFKYVTIVSKKEIFVIKTKVNIMVEEIFKYLNISFNSISVVTYDDKKIDNYNGVLTSNIKTIIYN